MASDGIDAALPPPLQDVPTAKEKKYDRQLRLWGASGQIALEESHILLINHGSGVAGVETLKNLVLPGIGHFTILDSAVVSEADLGVNFFLEDSSLGKFRAEETVKYLLELNPGVKGEAVTEPLETFISKDKVLSQYNLIIVQAPIDPSLLAEIQNQAQSLHIPTFYLHCVGFYSAFSLLLPSAFPIVDTHPDPTSTTDLRLLKPWPELIKFAKEKTAGLGTAAMSQHDKGHIPYVCLLLHYLSIWQEKHGKLPQGYKEKTAFREMVRAGDANEENYDEACAKVLKLAEEPRIPSATRDIFAAPEAQNMTAETPPFWIIANAMQKFCTKHGQLPLPGAVPDMKAQSPDYIQLQNIYKSKARQDFQEVLATVRDIEQSTRRSAKTAVDDKEIENFCKGAAHIHLVRGRPFQVVRVGKPVDFGNRATALTMDLTNPESLIGHSIAFLAWDEYLATHHRTSADGVGVQGVKIPGLVDLELEADTERVTGIAHSHVDSLIKQAGTAIEEPEYSEAKERIEKICIELVRAGGSELHNVAALTGGLLAQEVIKVITRQYIPIDNTCVFDGVSSRTYVLKL